MSARDRKIRKHAAIADVRIVEEILRRWDPIGVEPGAVAPADEYDGYAPHIVSMVEGGCAIDALVSHLEHLAAVVMGLGLSSSHSRAHSRKYALEIADALRSTD